MDDNYLSDEEIEIQQISWAAERQFAILAIMIALSFGIFQTLTLDYHPSLLILYILMPLIISLCFFKIVTYAQTIANSRYRIGQNRKSAGLKTHGFEKISNPKSRIKRALYLKMHWFLRHTGKENPESPYSINNKKTLFIIGVILIIFYYIILDQLSGDALSAVINFLKSIKTIIN